jgi:ORF6N domain-containing protein
MLSREEIEHWKSQIALSNPVTRMVLPRLLALPSRRSAEVFQPGADFMLDKRSGKGETHPTGSPCPQVPSSQGFREVATMAEKQSLVPAERIERAILLLRGQKVLLDQDLAQLYGVATKRLNQQVHRNQDRFPPDFRFQLTEEEDEALRLQNATSKTGRGGRRYRPYAYTEHGTLMAASVLNTPVAIRVSIEIVRAFVRLRELLATHKELARKLEELEKKYDGQFKVVFEAIRQLMAPPAEKPKGRIGFGREQEK